MNTVAEKTNNLKDNYLSDFDVFVADSKEEGLPFLPKLRQQAINHFTETGFPSKHVEEWKYTNVNPVLKHGFQRTKYAEEEITKKGIEKFIIAEKDSCFLVFVNGYFAPQLSIVDSLPDNVILTNIDQAWKYNQELFEQHYAKHLLCENNPFAALNTSFANDGSFVYIPDGVILMKPIQLLFISSSHSKDNLVYERNLIIIGKNSKADIVETHHSLGNGKSFCNTATEIIAGKNAEVEYCKIQNKKDYQIDTTQVFQSRDSRVTASTLTLNGLLVRNGLNFHLGAEGCDSRLFSLYLLSDKQHVDNHTVVDHASPNCYSNELYKGIMGGKSTGVFSGKIMVRKDAQKTNAFQQNNNILLSDEATINTKPQLEIYADDVKCSHGATIGQLDEEALFYLRARGIGLKKAKALLVRAFAEEALRFMTSEQLKTYAEKLIAVRLDKMTVWPE